jgi:amino acid transporter
LKDGQYITGSNYALLYEIIGCIAPFVILPIFAWTAFRYVMHFRGLKSWRKVFQIAILVLIGFIGFFSVFFYLTYNFFPILINVITNGGW